MRNIDENKNVTYFFGKIKIVVFFLTLAIILLGNVKNVNAEGNYYWPTPAVIDLSRGYTSSHKAIDIAAPEGTNIYATKAGTVIGVGNACSCIGNYPNCSHKFYAGSGYETGVGSGVMIKHDDGSGYSIYAHMTASSWPDNVYEGAHVNQGQFIGKTGDSGNSTGPHLHFVLMDNSATNWWQCNKFDNNKDTISYVYDYNEEKIADNTRVIDAGVTEITDTTAKINATVSPYGTVTECGFYFGTSLDDMEKVVESGTVNDCASIFYTLGTGKWTSALSKGTTYYYQIYGVIGGMTYKTSIGSFTTTGDSILPVIESATITNISSEGYTIEVVAVDNVGVEKVCCPTWTEANGLDDYVNVTATRVYDNTYTYHVNISDHNNERGNYVTEVYAYDMSGNTAKVELFVEVPEPIVSVMGVSLNQSSLTLEVGEMSTLTATVTPSNATNKTVTWTSSNTSVATVSNGTVKAVAPGTATITVKTADGSKTTTCIVTVKAKTISVASVALNKASASLTVGDTETLTATISPSNATNKNVTWTSSNTSVATVNNGVVTAIAPGTATITVKTVDGNKTATCVLTVEAVANPNAPKLVVSNAKGTAGDTVTVTVDLENNTGFASLYAYLTYSDDLTLVKTTNLVANLTFTSGASMLWDSVKNYNQDSGLLELTFTIDEDAKVGEHFVRINFLEAFTTDYEEVTFTTVDGYIEVFDFIYGDANGDDVVNTKDIIMLRQYLAAKDPVTGISTVEIELGSDANGDGVVNTKDIIMLRQYLAAKDPITGESSVVLGPTA